MHIAIDPSGHELDYYHTLSAEVGDSIEVIRSARTLRVETVALADEIAMGRVPPTIGFLKVDTEGHDLAVLHGLGEHSVGRNHGRVLGRPPGHQWKEPIPTG